MNEFLSRGVSTEGNTQLAWRDYAAVLAANLPQLITWPSLTIMAVLAWLERPVDRAWLICCGIPLSFVAAHFLLYPALYPRFFGWCGPIMMARAMSLWPFGGRAVANEPAEPRWRDANELGAADPRFNVDIPAPGLPPQPAWHTPSGKAGSSI